MDSNGSTQTTSRGTPRLLGQILLAAGNVGEDTLSRALDEQRRTRERLGTILSRYGTDPEHIARGLAVQLRLDFAPPPLRPTEEALTLVDGTLAARLRIVPLALAGTRLRIAMADPLDATAIDDLRFQTGRRIEAVVATPAAVDTALMAYHVEAVDSLLERIPEAEPAEPVAESPELVALRRACEAPPIVALVELMLSRAARAGASDVHIEPGAGAVRVRVRVDGVLRPLMELPAHTARALVSRIKVMADLDIATKRAPQDGRCALAVEGKALAFRVSTLPANGGEKVVLRILDPTAATQPLDALGMHPDDEAAFRAMLGSSHGVILVTGPTGSGKTTTLYAALSTLDRDGRNIVTLEDPVEYRLPGITQVQVHRRAGLSFASALRAVLRQDPDVIMVGELRDRETVETALAAAMTGHLVLSTLHTNDAPSAAIRLADMGAAPYLVAGAMLGVLAQRLARRPCPHCTRRVRLDAHVAAQLRLTATSTLVVEPTGCDRCSGTGFRGRTGIFELMSASADVRTLILRRASADAIRRKARDEGMVTLAGDAWRKLASGVTTLGEVRPLLATTGRDDLCRHCGAEVRAGWVCCVACGARAASRCSCGARRVGVWPHCARCGQRTRTEEDRSPPSTTENDGRQSTTENDRRQSTTEITEGAEAKGNDETGRLQGRL